MDEWVEDGWPELTIGEVAERAGLATSSIRYYERIGVLPEPQRESGQRRYGEDILGRLAFIATAKEAGFKLREVRELIESIDGDDGMAAPMRSLSQRRLPEVEELLERTKAMQGWLEVAAACDCESPSDCALFPEPGAADASLSVIRVDGRDCRRAPTR